MTVRKHRRNFLPTLIVNALLWLALFYTIFFASPDQNWPWILIGLISLFFIALGLTLSLLIGSSKKGFPLALIISLGFLVKALLSRQT